MYLIFKIGTIYFNSLILHIKYYLNRYFLKIFVCNILNNNKRIVLMLTGNWLQEVEETVSEEWYK